MVAAEFEFVKFSKGENGVVEMAELKPRLRMILSLAFSAGAFLAPAAMFAQAQTSPTTTVPVKSEAQASFGSLRNLAGSWAGQVTVDPPMAGANGPIQVTIRPASGGHALMHEMTPRGMIEPTLIYVDGDRLVLVHYCDAGNRPRLIARKSADPKTIAFDFEDLSGSTTPAYLHNLSFTVIADDHHVEDWTFVMADGKELHAHFDLKRAQASLTPAK